MFQPQPIYFSDIPYGATSQPRLSQNQYSYDQIPDQQQGPQQQQLRQNNTARSGGPTTFDTPTFSNIGAPTGLWGNIGQSIPQPQLQQRRIQGQQYDHATNIIPKMEGEDYEAQQALAGGYAPKLEGPLVGEKKSSHAITEEYAKADPVYVEKTRRLPQTYSYYRPVQGDGNCGWRAIGFSYFECLIKPWSSETVDLELARLFSLTNVISSFGVMDESMVEDFRDPMIQLLTDLSSLITSNTSSPNAAIELVKERFNDGNEGNHILYYLRCITAAQLLSNSMAYQPFLEQGMDLHTEQKTLMMLNTEIDYLGMTVLIDALMKPAGFRVEIVVLERSEGTEVNTHRFEFDNNGNPMDPNAPTAYILYKPGHYDILYKENNNHAFRNQQVLDAANAAQNVQVNRAAMPIRNLDPSPMPSMGYSGSFDMSVLASIPGMSMGSFSGFQPNYTAMSSSFAPSPSSFAPSPYGLDTSMSMSMPPSMQSAPIKSISLSPMSAASTLANIPTIPSQPSRTPPSNFPPSQFPGTALPSHPATRNNSIATDSGLLSSSGMTPTTPQILQQLSSLGVNSNDQFRQSRYVFERPADGGGGGNMWGGEGKGGSGVASAIQEMQTRQFRESHHNEAHYDNKNFQPYMWTPGDEGEEEGHRKGGKGGRRRAS